MESFYQFFELFATFVEGAIAVSVFDKPCRQKAWREEKYIICFFYVNNIHNTHNTLE